MQGVLIGTEDKKQQADAYSRWLIATGIGLTFALGTATTVYYLKTRQKREMKALRYGEDFDATVNYKQKAVKYWNLGVRTFQAVTSVIVDFLRPKVRTASPMVDAVTANEALSNPIDSQEAEP
jgi:hypothetical protein